MNEGRDGKRETREGHTTYSDDQRMHLECSHHCHDSSTGEGGVHAELPYGVCEEEEMDEREGWKQGESERGSSHIPERII